MVKYILIGLLACTFSYADLKYDGTPGSPMPPKTNQSSTGTAPKPPTTPFVPTSTFTLYGDWINAAIKEHGLYAVPTEEAPKLFREILHKQLQELIKLNRPATDYRTPAVPFYVRRKRTVEFIGLATAAIGLLYVVNPSSELSRSLNRPLSDFYHKYLYNKPAYIIPQTLAFILAANSTDISSFYATVLGIVASFSGYMVVQDLVNSSDVTNELSKPARLEALALTELKSIVNKLASAGINFNDLDIDVPALQKAISTLLVPAGNSQTLFVPLCEAQLTPEETIQKFKVRVAAHSDQAAAELSLAEEMEANSVAPNSNKTAEHE